MSEKKRRIERFGGDVQDLIMVDCCECVYKSMVAATCDAFPQGIPKAILTGKLSHREYIEGDNGIKFKRVKEGE